MLNKEQSKWHILPQNWVGIYVTDLESMILSSFNLMATCTLGPNITTYYIVGLKLENIATTNVVGSKKGTNNVDFNKPVFLKFSTLNTSLVFSLIIIYIPWYLIPFNMEYSYCTGTSTVYIQYICLSTYMNIEMENCPDFPHNYILGKEWEHLHMFVYYRYHQSNILVLWNSSKRNCKDLG